MFKTTLTGDCYHPFYTKMEIRLTEVKKLDEHHLYIKQQNEEFKPRSYYVRPHSFPLVSQVLGCETLPNISHSSLCHHFIISFSFLEFCSIF